MNSFVAVFKLVGYYTQNSSNYRVDVPELCPLCGKSRKESGVIAMAFDEEENEYDIHFECFPFEKKKQT